MEPAAAQSGQKGKDMRRKKFIVISFLALLVVSYNCTDNTPSANTGLNEQKDTLVYLNHADTAGYVGMKTCMLCHQGIHNTFKNTGMGKSFEHANKDKSAGDFRHSLIYDKFADFYYKAYWEGDSMKVLEFRLDKKDTVYKRIETVDFIIGSGQHTNSHMQSVNGYFNQMPMTFYTQMGKWDLPPGFENGHNTRFTRKIGLECMSCHNSYPEFVEGSENKYKSVPEGITCERCHGPGSIHVQERQTGSKIDTSKYIDYSIVNPAKLSIDAQFDICQRCHLQGNAIVKEGKSFYDFKPGMKLSDHISVFLPKYKNADDEFIMASHADRLKQSQCFIKSYELAMKNSKGSLKPYKDALTCVTCHNPHVSVRETNPNVFNDACNACHKSGGKSGLLCTEKSVVAARNAAPGHAPASLSNCTKCHMPRSGSIDIPHVTVHDHYIRKPVTNKQKEQIKEFIGLYAINEKNPDVLTKARAYINQYEKFELKTYYLDSARALLKDKTAGDLSTNIEALVQLYFLEGNYPKIISYVNTMGVDNLLKQRLTKKSWSNENAWTCYRIGEAFMLQNQMKQALSFYIKANELAPYNPEFKDKLASCYAQSGDAMSAEKYYKEALAENPKFTNALANYGFLCISTGRPKDAEKLYLQGLALDPDHQTLLMNMAAFYAYTNDLKKAIQYLEKVIKKYPNNSEAAFRLKQMQDVAKKQRMLY
jgi:tetratricopeptide (TPR) repeat protein